MEATEQYFPVVLFIMLYMVVLTFESVDETLKCDHSNESYRAVLSWYSIINKLVCTFTGRVTQLAILELIKGKICNNTTS